MLEPPVQSKGCPKNFAIVVAIFSRPLRGFIAEFNGFDGFRSQNPRVRANIRRQGRFWEAEFQAVEYRQDCQAGTLRIDFPT